MATTFGLTDQGFLPMRLADIKSQLEDSYRDAYGKGINLKPGAYFATKIGISADREATIWEAAEAIYLSQFRKTATGVSLDGSVQLTGHKRLLAASSFLSNQILFGTVGTFIDKGQVVSVEGNTAAKFVTQDAVTLVAGTQEQQHIAFSAVPDAGTWTLVYGDFITETTALAHNATAADVQTALRAINPMLEDCVLTGNYTSGFTLAGKLAAMLLLAISTNSLTISSVPVTVTITETVPGVPQGLTRMVAQSTGPFSAPEGSLTVIETAVGGWTGTINDTSATVGRNRETDLDLKNRVSQTLQIAGSATIDAIRSRVLNLAGVAACIIFENEEDTTVDGRPPHCYEVVVQGGTEQNIGDEIWASKPGGIPTFGSIPVTVLDRVNRTHTVNMSRPSEVPIYVIAAIVKDATYPTDGDVQVAQAIYDYGVALSIGQDVVVFGSKPSLASSFDLIPGITDFTLMVGIAPTPTLDDNISIGEAEVSSFSLDNIAVSST